jgi:hypothetical protein
VHPLMTGWLGAGGMLNGLVWGWQAKQRVRSIRKDAVDALKDAKGTFLACSPLPQQWHAASVQCFGLLWVKHRRIKR